LRKGVLLGVDSVLIGVLPGVVAREAYCLAARGCCSMRAAGASARISTDARCRVRAHRHCRGAAVCAHRGGYPVACRLAPERRSVRAAAGGCVREEVVLPGAAALLLTGVVLDAAAQGRSSRRWLAEHQVVMLGTGLPSIRLVAVRIMRAAPGSMARGCCSAPVAVAFCSAPGQCGSVGMDRCPLGVFLLGACGQCGVSGGGQDPDGRRPTVERRLVETLLGGVVAFVRRTLQVQDVGDEGRSVVQVTCAAPRCD